MIAFILAKFINTAGPRSAASNAVKMKLKPLLEADVLEAQSTKKVRLQRRILTALVPPPAKIDWNGRFNNSQESIYIFKQMICGHFLKCSTHIWFNLLQSDATKPLGCEKQFIMSVRGDRKTAGWTDSSLCSFKQLLSSSFLCFFSN